MKYFKINARIGNKTSFDGIYENNPFKYNVFMEKEKKLNVPFSIDT